MATTTASLTLSSSDLTSDSLSISATSTLYKAGTTIGLDQTTGLTKKVYATAQTNTVLVAASAYSDNGAHKLYIKNVGSSSTDAFSLEIDATGLNVACAVVPIGKLYGGDFLYLPWEGEYDIQITTTATDMELEYMIIYEA